MLVLGDAAARTKEGVLLMGGCLASQFILRISSSIHSHNRDYARQAEGQTYMLNLFVLERSYSSVFGNPQRGFKGRPRISDQVATSICLKRTDSRASQIHAHVSRRCRFSQSIY